MQAYSILFPCPFFRCFLSHFFRFPSPSLSYRLINFHTFIWIWGLRAKIPFENVKKFSSPFFRLLSLCHPRPTLPSPLSVPHHSVHTFVRHFNFSPSAVTTTGKMAQQENVTFQLENFIGLTVWERMASAPVATRLRCRSCWFVTALFSHLLPIFVLNFIWLLLLFSVLFGAVSLHWPLCIVHKDPFSSLATPLNYLMFILFPRQQTQPQEEIALSFHSRLISYVRMKILPLFFFRRCCCCCSLDFSKDLFSCYFIPRIWISTYLMHRAPASIHSQTHTHTIPLVSRLLWEQKNGAKNDEESEESRK